MIKAYNQLPLSSNAYKIHHKKPHSITAYTYYYVATCTRNQHAVYPPQKATTWRHSRETNTLFYHHKKPHAITAYGFSYKVFKSDCKSSSVHIKLDQTPKNNRQIIH